MENQTIELKSTVRVEELDTSYSESKYLLYCENKRWLINKFLYTLIVLVQNGTGLDELKDELAKKLDRDVTNQELSNAIDGFLLNRGIIHGTEDKVKKKQSRSDYLWLKIPLFSGSFVEKFKFLKVLYIPYIVIPVILFSTFTYIFGLIMMISNTEMSFGELLKMNALDYSWALLISLFAVIVHELGHMAALMKNGIKPGNIGFAIYYTSPVFYSDVNSAWELKRRQRFLVDIGGVYFQMLYLAVFCMIGILMNNKGFILSFIIGLIFMANNLNPFIKMDGYWVASDLLGIPNLHEAVSKYIQEKLFNLFRIKDESCITSNIKKKEKRIFIIYVLGTVIYMIVFMLGLFKLSLMTVKKIYTIFEASVLPELSVGNILSFIIDNIAIIITSILLIKIVFTTVSKLIKAIVGVIQKLKVKKRYPDNS